MTFQRALLLLCFLGSACLPSEAGASRKQAQPPSCSLNRTVRLTYTVLFENPPDAIRPQTLSPVPPFRLSEAPAVIASAAGLEDAGNMLRSWARCEVAGDASAEGCQRFSLSKSEGFILEKAALPQGWQIKVFSLSKKGKPVLLGKGVTSRNGMFVCPVPLRGRSYLLAMQVGEIQDIGLDDEAMNAMMLPPQKTFMEDLEHGGGKFLPLKGKRIDCP